MEFDKNQHLQDVLESHRMKHVQAFVDKMKSRRDDISAFLKSNYNKAYDTFNSGSMAKHTATNIKFDMDIVLPFKHDAFDTLKDMYEDVSSALMNEFKDVAVKIIEQKVSIGITFPLEEGDDKPVAIDVVPGRETSLDSYNENRDLNIYIHNATWGQPDGGYMKTNIQKQIEHITGRNDERKIIRLLKIWKKHWDKPYKSFVIELAVIKAFDQYSDYSSMSLWDRLKYTMEYIRDNVAESSFHLYDPGNSNNDVIANMSDYDRCSFSSDMSIMLKNINNNPSIYLPNYFPINEKYRDGYKEKQNGLMYPSSPKRFG